MKNNAELVRLEQFVDSLMAKYKELQATYTKLEASLEEKEAECERLKETVAELRSERSVVGDRVSGLIDRIEQWESGLGQDDEVGDLPADDDQAGVQGNLFDGNGETARSS